MDLVLYKNMDSPTKKMEPSYPSFSYTRNAALSNLIIVSKLYFMSYRDYCWIIAYTDVVKLFVFAAEPSCWKT